MTTNEEIAQSVLDAHAIRPDWRRTGEQVKALIIEALEKAEAVPSGVYKVGDPDPTPNNGRGRWCEVTHPDGPVCTWLKGHAGPHVAGDSEVIVAVWS